MRAQKYLVNLNHIYSKKSFDNFSNVADGFFVSSCHLKKDKMISLLNSHDHQNFENIYIDFFHYISTIEYSESSSERFKNEVNERLIPEIFINKNIVGLFLQNKENEAKKLIETSIQNWIKLTTSSNNNNFYYSLPLPMIGKGKIYTEIFNSYKKIILENVEKIKNVKTFAHIVLKVGNNIEKNVLDILNEILNCLSIKKVFISLWRIDDVLLTDSHEIEKVNQTIEYFLDSKKDVYLNYFHNEFIYFANKFDKKNINFVFGTFEQTKLLSPKIRWMNEVDNFQRFENKIYSEEYGVFLKQKRIPELLEVFDLNIDKKILDYKYNDCFKYNIIKMKDTLSSDILIKKDKVLKNILKITKDIHYKTLFNRSSKYSLLDYVKLYKES